MKIKFMLLKRIFPLSVFFCIGMYWSVACFSQSIGINTTGEAPNDKAILDIDVSESENKAGLLIPRMSTDERNTITPPIPESLLIYNTTIQCFEAFNADTQQWVSFGCIGCIIPISPFSGDHTFTETEITWNWSEVEGATGYKYNTIDDYATATDNIAITSFTQSGLDCSTDFTLYVWAYNDCGSSPVSTLTQSTIECPPVPCGSNIVVQHIAGDVAPVTKTVTYGTVSTDIGGTGEKCWITQNLGADQQASSATDDTEASAGWYWQFNRKQGYQYTDTRTPQLWNTDIDEDSDWEPENDPCTIELGEGWRIPTYTEWTNAHGGEFNQVWFDYNDTYNSVLKLHAAGRIQGSNGLLWGRGIEGQYWGTELLEWGDPAAGFLLLESFNCNMYVTAGIGKVYGRTLRCIRD